jgi:hypothetical protein
MLSRKSAKSDWERKDLHSSATTYAMALRGPKRRVMPMKTLIMLVVVSVATVASAQSNYPALYIQPTEDGFETYITAAILKKKVPVTVVTKSESAAYVLKAAEVDVQKETTGSKVVKCLFANCAGTEDKASTSVQLTRGDAVVWSYAVNKGRGAKNRQSMAESIAEHLKDDYLKKLK